MKTMLASNHIYRVQVLDSFESVGQSGPAFLAAAAQDIAAAFGRHALKKAVFAAAAALFRLVSPFRHIPTLA